MKNLLSFLKKEAVLCAAGLLAVISAFIVPPSAAYLKYIDYRVLALLFGLMLVVGGFQSIGFFRYLGDRLLARASCTRHLCLLLVFLCFFSSMFITNDVALLTFVPFAVMLFAMAGEEKLLIPVVVLQTIAANLGSMLTPIGNPQNLYLYSSYSFSPTDFVLRMLPLSALSAGLLILCSFLLPNRPLSAPASGCTATEFSASAESTDSAGQTSSPTVKIPAVHKLIAYTLLFLVCLLCVFRLISWPIMLGILICAVFFLDRKLFGSVDYFLLLTFVCFFLFIGNMQRIPAISDLLRSLITGRELLLGTLFSQCISNVPAAILLSGFTDQALPLLYGVNVGGLGTLIASLASVISYRLYSGSRNARKGAYLKVFTLYNVLFLVVLYIAAWFLLTSPLN